MKIIIVVSSILLFGIAFISPVKDIYALDISVSDECLGDFESNKCKFERCEVNNITTKWLYEDSELEVDRAYEYEDCSKYEKQNTKLYFALLLGIFGAAGTVFMFWKFAKNNTVK